jgi:hypothetical protein
MSQVIAELYNMNMKGTKPSCSYCTVEWVDIRTVARVPLTVVVPGIPFKKYGKFEKNLSDKVIASALVITYWVILFSTLYSIRVDFILTFERDTIILSGTLVENVKSPKSTLPIVQYGTGTVWQRRGNLRFRLVKFLQTYCCFKGTLTFVEH